MQSQVKIDNPTIDQEDIIGVRRLTVNVKFYYRVFIARNEPYARKIVSAMKAQDAKFRGCYVDRLKNDSSLSGFMHFELNASMLGVKTLSFISGSVKDTYLKNCLASSFKNISVNGPIHGKVSFFFSQSNT